MLFWWYTCRCCLSYCPWKSRMNRHRKLLYGEDEDHPDSASWEKNEKVINIVDATGFFYYRATRFSEICRLYYDVVDPFWQTILKQFTTELGPRRVHVILPSSCTWWYTHICCIDSAAAVNGPRSRKIWFIKRNHPSAYVIRGQSILNGFSIPFIKTSGTLVSKYIPDGFLHNSLSYSQWVREMHI